VNTSKTWVLAYDIHVPHHHKPSIGALLDFIRQNKVDGFVFGGDQLDLGCVSHHTQGKPVFRPRGSLKKNLDQFDREVLTPIEQAIGPKAEKIWLTGNHERFIADLLEEQPELEGMLSIEAYLRLKERGWIAKRLGARHRIGKLNVIHGDSVGSSVTVARKAVETWTSNVVMGHVHTYQAFTKISPVHKDQRWTATTLPCLCNRSPSYGRGRANGWLNGFGIVELLPGGNFNLFPIVISRGQFAFGGRLYGKKRKRAA
jgi:hypothetical protein